MEALYFGSARHEILVLLLVVNFVVASSAFAVIAAIVTVRGIGDLRSMLSRLRAQR
jgi:hypothetical protein